MRSQLRSYHAHAGKCYHKHPCSKLSTTWEHAAANTCPLLICYNLCLFSCVVPSGEMHATFTRLGNVYDSGHGYVFDSQPITYPANFELQR